MNKAIAWDKADWELSDEENAARLGCKPATVKARREQLKSSKGCKKGDFAKTTPAITLRLENALYDALEFFGILAGGFGKVTPVADIIRVLLIQVLDQLKETYPEEREYMDRFLSSKTVSEARSVFDQIQLQAGNLKIERAELENLMIWGVEIEERLKRVGIDRKHRKAFRQLARIKRASNMRPYIFHLRALSAEGDSRVGVTVYAPAKSWDTRCKLAFESKDRRKPLVLGLEIAEDEADLLRGLPKEASPRELFHKIFRDWASVGALCPRVEDDRIEETDCTPEAFRLFQQLKDSDSRFSSSPLD